MYDVFPEQLVHVYRIVWLFLKAAVVVEDTLLLQEVVDSMCKRNRQRVCLQPPGVIGRKDCKVQVRGLHWSVIIEQCCVIKRDSFHGDRKARSKKAEVMHETSQYLQRICSPVFGNVSDPWTIE